MKKIDLETIREKLNILKETNGVKISRAADMGCISFNINGSTYALHLQTAFRIRNDKEVLIANLDMYEPTETLENSPSFDWETFNWDIKGINLFDEWAIRFNKGIGNKLSVSDIFIDSIGDVTIKFDSNIILEVFLNSSKEEYLRFFKLGDKEHLVVTASGID